MNKYIKRYIRNREIALEQRFTHSPLTSFEINIFNFKNLNYYSLKDSLIKLLNEDIDNINHILKNKTFFQFDDYFYGSIIENVNKPTIIIDHFFKNKDFINMINTSEDFRFSSLFFMIKKNKPELLNYMTDNLIDHLDNIDPQIIANKLSTTFYENSNNIDKTLKNKNFIYGASKNFDIVKYSHFYDFMTDKQRLYFYYKLLKTTDLYFTKDGVDLYYLIYLRMNDFRDAKVKKSYLLLFLKNKKIKNILDEYYYSRLLELYEQIP